MDFCMEMTKFAFIYTKWMATWTQPHDYIWFQSFPCKVRDFGFVQQQKSVNDIEIKEPSENPI